VYIVVTMHYVPTNMTRNACSAVNLALHAHLSGRCFNSHAKRMYTASRNSCLFSTKFSSFNGIVDNEMEAPSDIAISFDFLSLKFLRCQGIFDWFLFASPLLHSSHNFHLTAFRTAPLFSPLIRLLV